VVPSSSCEAFTLEAVPGRRRNSSWTKSLRHRRYLARSQPLPLLRVVGTT
jgi:hypothetical protein